MQEIRPSSPNGDVRQKKQANYMKRLLCPDLELQIYKYLNFDEMGRGVKEV